MALVIERDTPARACVWRGRVELGLSRRLGDDGEISVKGFYDGIGSPDFASHGLALTLTTRF